MSGETEIRPFRVGMPDEAIADLRRRIAATHWPGKELVADRSQGVQLATDQRRAPWWATASRRCAAGGQRSLRQACRPGRNGFPFRWT